MVNYRGVKVNERNTEITAEIMQTYDLLKFTLARSNGSSFLLTTQYEMPFLNKSEATKRSKDRKIYGKCTNGTNRRSRVWPVFFIYIIWTNQNSLLRIVTNEIASFCTDNRLRQMAFFVFAKVGKGEARAGFRAILIDFVIKKLSLSYKTNRFHVAVRLCSNRSQKTSKCGKNISDTLGYPSCATFLFLPHFDVICGLVAMGFGRKGIVK